VEYNSTTNIPDWSQLHGVELYKACRSFELE